LKGENDSIVQKTARADSVLDEESFQHRSYKEGKVKSVGSTQNRSDARKPYPKRRLRIAGCASRKKEVWQKWKSIGQGKKLQNDWARAESIKS